MSPTTSGVEALHEAGIDPWVVDFGKPDHEPGGLERNLTDHVLAVSDAVERVAKATGRPVILSGYSQGGMFVYQAAAYRRGADIDSLVTFGSPVDTTAPLPIPLAPETVSRLARELVESGLISKVTVPSWVVRLGFKMLSPREVGSGPGAVPARADRPRRAAAPASGSAASSTRRGGRPTRARRSRNCWSSSSRTTGCSRAASSSTTGW